MPRPPAPPAPGDATDEHRVTPLELFFDLVFVFALTQVTAFYAADPTWEGLRDGTLILGTVWWAWVGYAWLTNNIDPERGWPRLGVLVAMAGLFIAGLAIPTAFGNDSVVFVCAIALVRVVHLVLLGLSPGQGDVRAAVKRFTPAVALGLALLLVSTGFDGAAQTGLWAAALLIDVAGAVLAGSRWKLHVAHFAERHGLVLIIALGESIVALGIGAQGLPLEDVVLLGASLGMVIAAGLWWLYFDVVAIVAERRVLEAPAEQRVTMARDGYSYLHFVMVLGIVLLALGLKKSLEHLEDPLKTVPAFALCGGPAVYLLGQALFRVRIVRSVNVPRLLVVVALFALIPLATTVSALAAMLAIAALLVGLVLFEVLAYREFRAHVRSELRGGPHA